MWPVYWAAEADCSKGNLLTGAIDTACCHSLGLVSEWSGLTPTLPYLGRLAVDRLSVLMEREDLAVTLGLEVALIFVSSRSLSGDRSVPLSDDLFGCAAIPFRGVRSSAAYGQGRDSLALDHAAVLFDLALR